MLEGSYALYRKYADEIDWKKYSNSELFREYIEHENDSLRDNFFAGIVCRYWGLSARIYDQCNHHITFDDCHDCMIDAIRYVLKNRVWEREDSSLYNDPAGPDKAMHIALKRQKGILLAKHTAYRRLSNFNTLSIDGAHESYNDSADGLLFDFESSESDLNVHRFIVSKFNEGDYFAGIVLDTICYNSDSHDINKLSKNVKGITLDMYDYFREVYLIDKNKFTKELKNVKMYSKNMLEMKIKALLYQLRKEFNGKK